MTTLVLRCQPPPSPIKLGSGPVTNFACRGAGGNSQIPQISPTFPPPAFIPLAGGLGNWANNINPEGLITHFIV